MDSSELFKKLTSLIVVILALGLLTCLILIFAMMLVTRRLSRQIKEFLVGLQRVADGNLQTDDPYSQQWAIEFQRLWEYRAHILTSLKSLIEAVGDIHKKIVNGHLAERVVIDPDLYRGEYQSILEGCNSIIDAIVKHIDSIPIPIMIYNTQHVVEFANKTGLEYAGKHSMSEVIGSNCFKVFHTSDCSPDTCLTRRVLMEKRPVTHESTYQRGSGLLNIQHVSIPVYDETQDVVAVMEYFIDVTATTNLVAELKERSAYESRLVSKLVDGVHKLSNGDLSMDVELEAPSDNTQEIYDDFVVLFTGLKESAGIIGKMVSDALAFVDHAAAGDLS